MTLADIVDDTASQAFAAIGFHNGNRREEVTYSELWAEATDAAPVAYRLSTEVGEEARLGALLTNDRPSVVLLMAAMAAGVTICSLPIPGRRASLDEYLDELTLVCRRADVTRIVALAEYVPFLSVPGVDVWSTEDLLALGGRGAIGPSERFGIIQHTAATSGPPKGVRFSDREICDHVELILRRINPDPGWRACSWLPLSHDMGLIGMLLASTAYGGSTWGGGGLLELLRPEDFVRAPWIWLQACSEIGASITAGPDFAFGLANRHVRRHQGIDLSGLSYVIVGGEMVRPETLTTFESNFAAAGFSRKAFAPCYGMAEACLAVSMPERGQGWTVSEVEAADLLGDDGDGSTLRLVSSGAPLEGVEIETRQEDDVVRQILVRGPQVVAEYIDGSRPETNDGFLATGDMGTIVDGQLYVAGRFDDVLVALGRNFSAGRLEEQIGRATGRPPHTIAAVNMMSGGIALAMEIDGSTNARERSALLDEAIRCCVFGVGVRPEQVHVVDPGDFPRTSVGKLQRRRLAEMLSVSSAGAP